MRRFFVKNLLFVLAVNLLVKPVWVFLIDITVQKRVGNHDYGAYQSLVNLSVIFQILLDFGLTNYNSRAIAREPDKLAVIFPSMLSARLLLALVYGVITCLMGFWLEYTVWEMSMLLAVLFFQTLNSLLQFLRSNVAGLHRFKADGVLSILDRFLMIVVCGVLLLLPATADSFRIEWFIYAQVGCYAVAAVVSFIVLKRISKVRLRFYLDTPAVLKIMKESFPYAALIFLMSIYTRADIIMLKSMLGAEGNEQSGIYTHSYRLLDVCNMFGLMFATMLLPMFGRMLLQKVNLQPIIQLCVNLLLPVSVSMAIVAAFYGHEIVHYLYPNATENEGSIFALLMGSFPAFCMMYVYSTLLTANGSMGLLIKIAAAGVVLNLFVNYALIPEYKAVGAAIGTVATQSVLALCFIFFSGRKLQLPTNIKWIGAHVSFIILSVVVGYFTFLLPGLEWYVRVVLFGIICLILMLAFGFVSIRSIKQLANK